MRECVALDKGRVGGDACAGTGSLMFRRPAVDGIAMKVN